MSCFICAAVAEAANHDHLPMSEVVTRSLLGVLAGVVVAGPTRVLAGLCNAHTMDLWPVVARLRKIPQPQTPPADPN